MTEQTFGDKAVGRDFNPSGNVDVDEIKQLYARIIDVMDGIRANGTPERQRLCSVAITEAQGAQMWAVKAVTWRDE